MEMLYNTTCKCNKNICFSIALILSTYSLLAQNRVQGIVVDSQGKAIESVNIVAIQKPDSVFISGCLTDGKGYFKFDNLPPECYLLFSSIGYQKQSIRATEQMRVMLQDATTNLSEVSVAGHRIKERSSGYTIWVQNAPFTQGKKVIQVLELLPHINIEQGKVTIINKPVEAIYVDELRLQSQSELETLPVDRIARIEVDYTSSVREGASATGGVLRIYLKEQNDGEWSMNLGADTYYSSHYGWGGASISNNLSARWNKITLRNDMSMGKELYYSDDETNTTDIVGGLIQHSLDEYRDWTNSFSNRLSISTKITPKHLVASSLLYRSVFSMPEHTLTDWTHGKHSYHKQHNPVHLWQWLATYKWNLSNRTTLGFFTDFLAHHNKQTTVEQRPLFYTGAVEQQMYMSRIKAELQQEFKGGAKLTLGGDLQWIRKEEKAVAFVPTDMNSSMYSLFSSYANRVGNLQYEIGLRLQNNIMNTTQAGNMYSYSYTSLYPSLSAMYLIDRKHRHMFRVNVERVMGTIPYSAISGYRQYSGEYNYSVGNPKLTTPIGIQAMGILSLWGELSLNLGIVHYKSPIYFDRRIDSEQPKTTYTIPMNGNYEILGIASLEWQHKVTKWWNIKTSATLRSHSADAGVLVRNRMSSIFRHNSMFTFTPSFSAGLRLSYEPTFTYLDRTMNAVSSVSADVYKTILKGKMDIRFNAVLYRKERSSITSKDQFTYYWNNLTQSSPSFTLSISYRLGKGTKVKALEGAKELQRYKKTEDVK